LGAILRLAIEVPPDDLGARTSRSIMGVGDYVVAGHLAPAVRHPPAHICERGTMGAT